MQTSLRSTRRVHNVQVGGDNAGDVSIVVNDAARRQRWWADLTRWIDVKLTEEDSPAFFDFVGSHDWHAYARVQVAQGHPALRNLPLAVPIPDPKTACAMFFAEGTARPPRRRWS